MATFLLKKRQKKPSLPQRRNIPVICADAKLGLRAEQVHARAAAGWLNLPVEPPGKSVKQIILSNVCTYFNLIFTLLALAVALVRQWQDLTFLIVVICNAVIGIIQDLRAKKVLDKMNILASHGVVVIRDGQARRISQEKLVRDDIVEFSAGCQICADAVVADGQCHVNEALITGEPDEVQKNPGDSLLSGSFVINGVCRARLTAVGADSYASKLTLAAKANAAPRKSEMMRSLTNLIKWIGVAIIPLGVFLFLKEQALPDTTIANTVSKTVGALVGMIPEGLYLLTSLALVAGVIRLAKRKTLVHNMDCIEALARVDTLCVDKTGTITENKMIVEDIALLCEDRYIADDIRMIMADYVFAMQDDNDTMAALKKYFNGTVHQTAEHALAFSSAKKYGGVSFHADETYLLGAPDILLAEQPECSKYTQLIEQYSAKGCRVLLLALYDGTLDDEKLTAEMMPLALILLSNKIRADAPKTFAYFTQQGVNIKVISGDNPATVSEVARRAEIPNAEKFIDARTLTDERALREAAEAYTVFGRVTPDQKKKLVQALKAKGHTVAMTGDGVNDVLALREADCSIAMASGSDVACQASHLVLLDSCFSSLPSVVSEGRRVINNIERSASLYLVKNIFSFCLSLITLIFTLPYPYSPAQLTLVNMLTIGLPSFVLAMEPNENRITGKFLRNVIYRAIPTALTNLVLVIGVMLFYLAFDLDSSKLSTICTGIMGIVGILMVYETCKPFNKLRAAMMGVIVAGFWLGFFLLPGLFKLDVLDGKSLLILIVLGLLAWSVLRVFKIVNRILRKRLETKPSKVRRRRRSREK